MSRILKRVVLFAALFALAASLAAAPGTTAMAAENAPKQITLNKKNVTMTAGSRTTLKVTSVKPKAAAKKVTWKTSDHSVASVSARGVVKAKKAGTAVITAKAAKGKAAAKCRIRVENVPAKEEQKMKMQVTDGTHKVIFELNDSPAAKSLYKQLPLTVDVENYSDDEKIFYPKKLDTRGAVKANAKKGTLAYFSPWGDVVMYYRNFGSYSGLYELGHAVSGSDEIISLSGSVDITVVE